MTSQPKRKVHFFVNALNGEKYLNNLKITVDEVLDHTRFVPEFHLTKHGRYFYKHVKKTVGEVDSIVVAVGGDGTVNQVARPFIGTGQEVAIIPGGSGNGLARHLGIPLNPREAINIINKGNKIKIDTGIANDQPFFSIAGVGFEARVANLYRKEPSRGFQAYFRIIASEFLRYKPHNYRLIVDGVPLNREAMMITFANASQFGYNTMIAPKADITDGMIDVVVVKKFPKIKLPVMMSLLYQKKIDESDYIEHLVVHEAIIIREKGHRINIDGEAIKMKKEIYISINPASLNVIVP